MKYFILFAFIFCFSDKIIAAESFAKLKAPINDAKDADAIGIELAQKKKNQYLMRDCPVVGNTQSGIYHLPGQPNYKSMLVVNKCAKKGKCTDNRRCFDSEAEALETEVCVKNTCRKYKKSKGKVI